MNHITSLSGIPTNLKRLPWAGDWNCWRREPNSVFSNQYGGFPCNVVIFWALPVLLR
jgi:hypothetical protein